MNILCVIGARGGSKGVPGKNIKAIHGKPLIVWSIEQALQVSRINKLIVSTDSEQIAKVAKKSGADVPFLRPMSLAGPEVGKFQVWQHALSASEEHYGCVFDILVDLDCTNPLRDVSDINGAIDQFLKTRDEGVDAVFTVCPARKNPYFNIVEKDGTGALRMSKQVNEKVLCRQNAPEVFDHVASIYVLGTAYVKQANHLLDGHAEGYDIGFEKSFDIDSPLDAEIVEFLLKRKWSQP
jgi:CMP-N,N'-diacetyllegionaminic acid synthase